MAVLFSLCTVLLLLSRSLARNDDLLEGILQLIILSHKVLSPLLCHDVLDNNLLAHLFHVSSNESRVPEFGGDTQVLAAAHESI